jgi:hypothetical protein
MKVVRVLEYVGEDEWVEHTLDRSERSVTTPKGTMREVYRSDGRITVHEALSPELRKNHVKCVVCKENDQTDMIFLRILPEPTHQGLMYIGFPVCSEHTLADLKPDQYVMDNLIVEVH